MLSLARWRTTTGAFTLAPRTAVPEPPQPAPSAPRPRLQPYDLFPALLSLMGVSPNAIRPAIEHLSANPRAFPKFVTDAGILQSAPTDWRPSRGQGGRRTGAMIGVS